MYPIQTITLNIKFKQKCTGMKSSHDAPIIHAFNLAQKRFFQLVKSQKPRNELSTCRSLGQFF